MLSGPDGVPDAVSRAERINVHRGLRVPDGFVAIAPPVSHIVMRGPTLTVHSVTDFEAHLIGRSLAPALARDQLRAWIAADLERRISESLRHLACARPALRALDGPAPPFTR